MSDEPDAEQESTPIAAQSWKRWQREWLRGHGRRFRIAGMVVVFAGIVVLLALAFWSGFLGGASNGHHHHHSGGGHHGAMMDDELPAAGHRDVCSFAQVSCDGLGQAF